MTTYLYTAVAYDPGFTADCMGVSTNTDARTAVAGAIEKTLDRTHGSLPLPLNKIIDAVLTNGSYGRNGEYGDEDRLYVRIDKFKAATTILSISPK